MAAIDRDAIAAVPAIRQRGFGVRSGAVRFRVRTGTPVAVAVVLGSAALTGCATAAAQPLQCGSHVTAHQTLKADLYCPKGNGLIVDSAVSLDLGGHRLLGPGSKIAGSTGVAFGPAGGSVVNGQIQGWATGVSGDSFGFDPIGRMHVTQVTFTGNGTGAYAADVKLTVSKSKFVHNAEGLFGFYGQIDVHESQFAGDGASDSGAGYLTIDRSGMEGTGSTEASATCSESGLTITNTVIKNYALPAGGWNCGGAVLTGNTFAGDKIAYRSTHDLEALPSSGAPGDRIVKNTFSGNGIAIDSGVSGRITHNTFTGNQTGLVTGNLLSLYVLDNTFANNTSSGLHATSASGVYIGGNVATHNGRYGIYAPGGTDLGGNVASGNGRSPQCVGVMCAGS